jgi:hypothetical protein
MKTLQRCCSVLLLASVLALATGCATHDRRDTRYDPDLRKGQTLFDQMPNWEYQCGVKGGNRC